MELLTFIYKTIFIKFVRYSPILVDTTKKNRVSSNNYRHVKISENETIEILAKLKSQNLSKFRSDNLSKF